MEYPILNVKPKSRQMIDAFLGYNHNLRCGENEFYEIENMTSDYYPVLATRERRGIDITPKDTVYGIIGKDELCYVDGTDFVIGEERVDMGLAPSFKDLISMGSYVIIMPDRKYVNTVKVNGKYEVGDIDEVHTTTKDVKFTLCTITGGDYELDGIDSATAPTTPTNGQLWLDTSSEPHTLKKYSKASEQWVSIATTYIKVSSKGIGKNLKKYDGVKISGITAEGLTDLNSSHTLMECTDDSFIITGMLEKVTTQKVSQGEITISRKMPVMDFITESNNRLWGCRYGTNEDGNVVNEIYACKLGDFKNWNCFMNLATDSYAASCGTDGPFTGAITHLGYPLFFKENCVHKVYGNYPANFQIVDTTCRGVQKGSHKSLAIVNETVFYKSTNAVCAYDGSLPVEVSAALGKVNYSKAVACAYGNKYYIQMKAGSTELFVYDTAKNIWHKENGTSYDNFETLYSSQGKVYGILDNRKGIVTLAGSENHDAEEYFHWSVETGNIGMNLPDMKYISKLLIRMFLDGGATATISIKYDEDLIGETVYQVSATNLRSICIPIRPRRCDHFKIGISGKGNCRIYSITKTIEQGSDIS